MDTSNVYIEMCKNARVLQYRKHEDGFDEGDFVYDGKTVRVVGHDFLNMGQVCIKNNMSIYKFAIMEEPTEFIDDGYAPMDILHRTGTYKLDNIPNPVWLPRLDQMISMLGDVVKGSTLTQLAVFVEEHKDNLFCFCESKFPTPSIEIQTFAFLMYKIYYSKYFVSDGGVCNWYTLNEYNRDIK